MSVLRLLVLLAGSAMMGCQPEAYDPNLQITLREPGARLPLVLAQINRQIGTRLSADPAFNNEVFLIQVERRRLGDVLEIIERSVEGTWQAGGRLVPDPNARQKRQAAWRETWPKVLDQAVRKHAAIEKKLGPVRSSQINGWLENGIPKETEVDDGWLRLRMASVVLPNLPRETLANLKDGQYIIFSTQPMEGELPLDPQIHNAILAVVGELQKTRTDLYPSTGNKRERSVLEGYLRVARDLQGKQFSGIRVSLNASNIFMWGSVHLLSKTGAVVASVPVSASGDSPPTMVQIEKKEKELPLSGLRKTHAYFVALSMGWLMGTPTEWNPGALPETIWAGKAVLDPVEFEPLREMYGSLLSEALTAEKREAVLRLDDTLVEVHHTGVLSDEEEPGATALLRGMWRRDRLREDKGILSLNHPPPASRVDRAALRTLLQKVRRDQLLRWDDLMTYAGTVRGVVESPMISAPTIDTRFLAGALSGSPKTHEAFAESYPLWVLIARMPATDRKRLENGTPVRIADLPTPWQEELRDAVRMMAFRINPVTRESEPTPNWEWPLMRFSREIPGQATLRLVRSRKAAVIAKGEERKIVAMGLEQARQFLGDDGWAKRFRYQVGTEETINVRLAFNDDWKVEASLPLYTFEPNRPFGDWKDLPASIREGTD